MSSNCCPLCLLYERFPGVDFCCRTCRDTGGYQHGPGCLRMYCQYGSVYPVTMTTAVKTNDCCEQYQRYKRKYILLKKKVKKEKNEK